VPLGCAVISWPFVATDTNSNEAADDPCAEPFHQRGPIHQ
jgi:hypothetical protein